MLILFSISRGLEIWSVNHTSIYENSEFKDFWKYDLFVMKFSWTNDKLRRNVYKSLESCW